MTIPAATLETGASIGLQSGITLSLGVSDYERSKAWYRGVLGMAQTFEVPEIGWCEFQTPTHGVTIGLSKVEEVGARGGVVPVFSTADIEQTRARLESQGVRFDGPTQTIPNMVMLATFYDPDGHSFMLSQNLAIPG